MRIRSCWASTAALRCTDRTHDMPLLPDEIALFRGPIERASSSRADAMEQIRETVMHELGHYFGLGHDEMPY